MKILTGSLLVITLLLSTIWSEGVSADPNVTSMDLRVPSGNPPEDGWPVMVYLHAVGVSRENYNAIMEIVTESGMAAMSLTAPPIKRRRNKPRWDSVIDLMHTYLQMNLEVLRQDRRFDLSRVHLLGIMQGASHAVLLTMYRPESYSGVVVASPSVAKEFPDSWEPNGTRHPMFLVYQTKETSGVEESISRIKEAWRRAGQDVREHRHSGGTTGWVPGWESVLAQGLSWIMYRTS